MTKDIGLRNHRAAQDQMHKTYLKLRENPDMIKLAHKYDNLRKDVDTLFQAAQIMAKV